MEAESSLVRSDRAVELDAVAEVGLNLTVVVDPGDTENEDSVRLYESLNDLSLLKLRMLVINFLD